MLSVSLSHPVKFPCGKQWTGLSSYHHYRSLDSNDTQVLTHTPNSSHNSTHTGASNSTILQGVNNNSNSTEQGSVRDDGYYYGDLEELEANDTRIVGGQLQKQGGSPWQVRRRWAGGANMSWAGL